MLVNIIQNTISSFRSALAAASVITTNLKMWLGFETSETLGREEVVNGDFATDSDWTKLIPSGQVVEFVNNQLHINYDASEAQGTTGVRQSILTVGKTYEISIDIQSITRTLTVLAGGVSNNFDTIGVKTFTVTPTTNALLQIINPFGAGLTNNMECYINSISVKELTQITPDKSGNNNVGELFTGKALDFNGSTEYVNTTGFEMAGTSATFAFWIYPKDTAYQFVMDLDGTVRTILGLFNGGSGQVFAFFNSGFKQFGTPIQNQWQRVVFRVNATTVECYVDGVKSGSTLALTTSIDLSTVGNSVIGGRFDTTNAANRFDGSLSDFQIYNAYWSTDDIAFDYANPNILVTDSTNTGTSIAVTNLKAYWAMSEGDGLVAYDSSGEGNNGTINGATYEPAQPRIPQLGMQNWSKGSNLLTYSEDFSEWTLFGNTITSGFESPLGDNTAYKISDTGTSTVLSSPLGSTTGFTRSIYARTVSGTGTANLLTYFGNADVFNLTETWQRFEVTGWSSTGATSFYAVDFRGTGTLNELLIWGAQEESGASAGAYRLTDGAATLNSTVIANPTIPTKDILGNAVRDRLNSFNLDGTGYAEVADDTDLDFGTGDFTIECWAKFDFENKGSTWNSIVSLGDSIVSTTSAGLATKVGKFYFNIGGTTTIGSTPVLVVGDWYHVVGTRTGTTMKLYINTAVESITATSAQTVTNTGSKIIGDDAAADKRAYENLISDVRLYSVALSATEIENNYNAGLSAHTN